MKGEPIFKNSRSEVQFGSTLEIGQKYTCTFRRDYYAYKDGGIKERENVTVNENELIVVVEVLNDESKGKGYIAKKENSEATFFIEQIYQQDFDRKLD